MSNLRTLTMNGTMPTLYIPYPRCGHCDEEVDIEEGTAYCVRCRIEWPRVEEDCYANPDTSRDDTEVPCQIVAGNQDQPHDDRRGNHYVPGPPQPCILPSGHEGAHLCPYDVEVTSTIEAAI